MGPFLLLRARQGICKAFRVVLRQMEVSQTLLHSYVCLFVRLFVCIFGVDFFFLFSLICLFGLFIACGLHLKEPPNFTGPYQIL